MRRRLAFVVVAIALVSGCGEDNASPPAVSEPSPTPASTATSEPIASPPPPAMVSDALPPAEALTDDNLDGAWFVVDVESGLMQVVRTTAVNPCPTPVNVGMCMFDGAAIFPSWYDADTLLVYPQYGPPSLVDLDGTSVPAPPPPDQTPLPRGETASPSADGRWLVYSSEGGAAGVTVRDGSDVNDVRYRITNAAMPRWSPSAPDVLALIVDVCSGFDLALFEPDSGELRRIDESATSAVLEYLWSPDGGAIAAGIMFTGDSATEPRRELVVVDVPEAFLAADALIGVRTLAAISREGELVPVGWNANGRKLLFRYMSGRGFCDDGDGQPRDTTKVEPLAR